MPAYNEETDMMATKVVTLYAENKKCGLPSIHATVLLHDVKNGKLKAVYINIYVYSMLLNSFINIDYLHIIIY